MAKPGPKARRLAAAGELLYGPRWQSALARATGMAQSAISMIVSGERAVTDDVQRKLADALGREAGRLRGAAGMVDRLRHEIEKAIGT